jgi:HEPN domain-containing protein
MLDIGKFDAAVFYAALAGENAGNALVITVGGRPSKRHRVDAALDACFKIRKEKIPAEVEQAIEKLKWLEPHVTISRYPVKIGGKWVAPPDRYRGSDAGKAIAYAEVVVRVAKSTMSPSQKIGNRSDK